MKVIDINGKEREVVSIKKMSHAAVDAISGETVDETFLEVVIKGHNRIWTEWWPLEEYQKYNPGKKPHWKK